jgi:chromosome segregation ATPase
MKVAAILLGVALLIVGVLYYRETEHRKDLTEELAAVKAENAAAQLELTMVKTQMIARVAELEVALDTEKTNAATNIGQLQERVKTVEQELQDEKNKLATVDDQRARVVEQLTTVSNQLTTVRQQYEDLQRTHSATEKELAALRGREASLEMEKASLERQLNDLDALKAQIRVVKRQLWEKHVEEWKRQDAEATARGNKGVIFQNGRWLSAPK